ncbi:MAG: succinylglutamate desuccinylase/aspartoacylase family protein [Cyclobacteriaceae bacterium]|nr:succinylglutamate desuccinylase/aspartoacylase family protein [Cyclobacteriaceae bacterium]
MTFDSILSAYGFATTQGTKSQGFIAVEGTPVKMPATLIVGAQPGKQILITGGVHGGEYPCIETAIQLAKTIDPKKVKGTILVIHPVNVPAFLAKLQYYGPYDGKNLNRVFPGKATGTVSERIAYTVHQLQLAADFYIDLHGGDIHESLVPFVIYSNLGGGEITEQSKAASAALGFPYVVGSVSDNGSMGAAAKAGTPGFLAELGQCGRWSKEEVEQYIDATSNVLRSLGVMEGTIKSSEVTFLKKMAVMTAEDEGCWYAFKNLEEKVKKGEVLGEIRDFFGNVLREYKAEEDGVLLYVVTSLAITKGDPLTAIGVV